MERRTLLRGAVYTGTLTASTVFAQNAGKRVRKNVSLLTPASVELNLYRQAVEIMKKLPTTDPRNWQRQAQIHQNYCPHGNWWFLPWHRACIFYFEQTCRDVLNNQDFVLPYWDWTRNPRIPAPFWEGTLRDSTRLMRPNDEISSEVVGTAVISRIMNSRSIETLYSGATSTDNQRERSLDGILEATPHNNVHTTVLGNMGSFMSPLDPVFWLHHANVDRIWESSFKALPSRVPDSDLWAKHKLAAFYDPVTKANQSPTTLDTMKSDRWGAIYDNYETSTRSPTPNATRRTLGFNLDNKALLEASGKMFATSSSVAVQKSLKINQAVKVGAEQNPQLSKALSKIPVGTPENQEAYADLIIEGVPQPKEKNSRLRVYLNCKNLTVDTPIDDPSYVGTVGFFNHGEGHDHHTKVNFVLEISRTITKLSEVGLYQPDAPLEVALIAINPLLKGKDVQNEVLKPERVRIVAVT